MNNSKLVILIEDEPSHAILYKYKLLTEGYNVAELRGNDSVLEEINQAGSSIGLVVLSSLPILLLTTAPELAMVVGQENFQYLTKPFALDLFTSKVKLLFTQKT